MYRNGERVTSLYDNLIKHPNSTFMKMYPEENPDKENRKSLIESINSQLG